MAGNELHTYRSPRLQAQLKEQQRRTEEMRRRRDRLDRERRAQRQRERRQRLLSEQEAAGTTVETTQEQRAEIMAAELPSLIDEQRTDGVSERSTNENDPVVMAAELPSFVPTTVEGTESIETGGQAEQDREALTTSILNSFFWDAQTVINAKETFAAARSFIVSELGSMSVQDLQELIGETVQDRIDVLRYFLQLHKLNAMLEVVKSDFADDPAFVLIAKEHAATLDDVSIEQAIEQVYVEYESWKQLQKYELERAAESAERIKRGEQVARVNEARRTINDAMRIDQEEPVYGGDKEGMRKAAAASGELEDKGRAQIREAVAWQDQIADRENDISYDEAEVKSSAIYAYMLDKLPHYRQAVTGEILQTDYSNNPEVLEQLLEQCIQDEQELQAQVLEPLKQALINIIRFVKEKVQAVDSGSAYSKNNNVVQELYNSFLEAYEETQKQLRELANFDFTFSDTYWEANDRTGELQEHLSGRSAGRSAQPRYGRPRAKKAGWVDQVNPSVDTFRERPVTTKETKREQDKIRRKKKVRSARAAAERRRQQIRRDSEQQSTEVDPRYLGKRTRKKASSE